MKKAWEMARELFLQAAPIIRSAKKDPSSDYWNYRYYRTFADYLSAVTFPKRVPVCPETAKFRDQIRDRNPYPTGAYMVVADDTEREWGPQNWEQKSAEYIGMGYIR